MNFNSKFVSSSREPLVDALRALALLGVVIVNALGYPSSPNYPMPVGSPVPADSVFAVLLNGFLIAFVQGKAYPLLCFLFGYSLCSMALQSKCAALQVQSRLKLRRLRYWKLLLVGILHGALVYFGDVLTIYAVCGLVAAKWVLYKPARLLKIFRNLSVSLGMLSLLYAMSFYVIWLDISLSDLEIAKDLLEKLADKQTLLSYIHFNATTYFSRIVEALLTLPIYLWLTVAGMLTCRFRLLSSRTFAQKFWKAKLRTWQFITAFALNMLVSMAIAYQQYAGSMGKLTAFGILSTPINIWFLAGGLAISLRYLHKSSQLPAGVHWLAPAGRHTLAMYLSLSVMLLLTSAVFLNMTGSTAVRFFVALAAWLGAVLIAKAATKRGLRDPIASWLSAKA